MRRLAVILLLAPALLTAQPAVYEEPRDLSLNAEGVERLEIDADAGTLRVTGIAESSTIVVQARIRVPDADPDEARRIIESDLVLSFAREGDRAVLEARFRHEEPVAGHGGSVMLEVTVPEATMLRVEDGSGALEILNVYGNVEVTDGSGAITMQQVGGTVRIDDGSGTMFLQQVGGDLSVVDGSGSLSVENVEGSVRIEDGSGGITVSGVEGDLDIPDAGRGAVEVSDIAGRIDREN